MVRTLLRDGALMADYEQRVIIDKLRFKRMTGCYMDRAARFSK